MPNKPVSLDHVNLYVRNVERSHQWYTELLNLHTQDIFYYELPRSEWHQDHPLSEQDKKGRFPGPWDEALRQSAPAAARA